VHLVLPYTMEVTLKKIIIVFILLINLGQVSLSGAADLPIAEFPDGTKYIANRIVVVNEYEAPSFLIDNYNSGYAVTGVESVDRLCRKLGVIHVEPFYPGILRKPVLIREISRIYKFTLDQTTDVRTVAAILADDPNIESVELQFIPKLFYTPNDPYIDQQWYLDQVNVYEAWDIIRGDDTRNSIVGVVDAGIDYLHPDLADNIWINELEDINGNGRLDPEDNNFIDDDDNGIVDDVIGWDFAEEDYDPMANNPHGTGVAGCISEATDNEMMGAGIGFSARLMVLKAITDNGYLVDGYLPMLYAAENGATVINCSWGVPIYREFEQAIIEAVWESDVLIVAAGGEGDQVVYPAGYNHVMAVSATDQNDHKAPFGPYGDYIDICAPGVELLIPWDDDLSIVSGTSFSAGMVSGLAALIRAWVETDNQNTQWLIEEAADPIDHLNPGYEGLLGHGRINAGDCVTAIEEISAVPVEHSLIRNYPNPFNSSTEIRYALSEQGNAELIVYDLMGREVAVLVDEVQPAGNYSLTWDASRQSSGVYFARLRTNAQSFVCRLVLLK